ncbi:unnamed protein product [Bursaphelenchus okinawaensis]|uniref:separase n=1 Tax=Bursaphelenchus okinawaensis TaxID=465554 RepID=A0A811JPY8_9BILA|nr:unnamed protein product [Bursaphelenchus okinawaensis]CAG9076898.1 unnamed protein product [Bursaphelenchus okinawaensis]
MPSETATKVFTKASEHNFVKMDDVFYTGIVTQSLNITVNGFGGVGDVIEFDGYYDPFVHNKECRKQNAKWTAAAIANPSDYEKVNALSSANEFVVIGMYTYNGNTYWIDRRSSKNVNYFLQTAEIPQSRYLPNEMYLHYMHDSVVGYFRAKAVGDDYPYNPKRKYLCQQLKQDVFLLNYHSVSISNLLSTEILNFKDICSRKKAETSYYEDYATLDEAIQEALYMSIKDPLRTEFAMISLVTTNGVTTWAEPFANKPVSQDIINQIENYDDIVKQEGTFYYFVHLRYPSIGTIKLDGLTDPWVYNHECQKQNKLGSAAAIGDDDNYDEVMYKNYPDEIFIGMYTYRQKSRWFDTQQAFNVNYMLAAVTNLYGPPPIGDILLYYFSSDGSNAYTLKSIDIFSNGEHTYLCQVLQNRVPEFKTSTVSKGNLESIKVDSTEACGAFSLDSSYFENERAFDHMISEALYGTKDKMRTKAAMIGLVTVDGVTRWSAPFQDKPVDPYIISRIVNYDDIVSQQGTFYYYMATTPSRRTPKSLTPKGNNSVLQRKTVEIANRLVCMRDEAWNLVNLWKEVQQNMLDYFTEQNMVCWGLVEVKHLERTEKHFKKFTNLLSLDNLTEFDRLFKFFMDQYMPAIRVICGDNRETRDTFLETGQLLTSLCLVNGEQYNAIRILLRMVQMDSSYSHVFINMACYVALNLGDVQMYKLIRLKVKQSKDVLVKWLSAMDLWAQSLEKDSYDAGLVKKALKLQYEYSKDCQFTYFLSLATVSLRHVLINESKKPNADMTQTKDTLMHQHCIYDQCFGCVCGNLESVVDSNGFFQLFSKKKDRFFGILDTTFYVYTYIEATKDLIFGMIDAGLMREAESRSIANLGVTISLMSPFRTYEALNLYYYVRSEVTVEHHNLSTVLKWYNALIYPQNDADDQLGDLTEKIAKIQLNCQKYQYHEIPVLPMSRHPRSCKCLNCLIDSYSLNHTYTVMRNELSVAKVMCKGLKGIKPELDLVFDTLLDYYTMERKAAEVELEQKVESYTPLKAFRLTIYIAKGFIKSLKNVKNDDLRNGLIAKVLKLFQRSKDSRNRNILRAPYLLLLHYTRPNPELFPYPWLHPNKPANAVVAMTKDYLSAILFERDGKVFEAYSEMKEYRHLLYREWRYEVATYLAANSLYFTESMAVSVRASIRRKLHRKIEHENLKTNSEETLKPYPLGFINDSNDISNRNANLPDDTTILQLVFDANDILWLVRYNKHQDILFSIPLTYVAGGGSLEVPEAESNTYLRDIRRLLIRADESITDQSSDGKVFWKVRTGLEKEYQELLQRLENAWITPWAPLFKPLSSNTLKNTYFRRAMKDINELCSLSTVAILTTMALMYTTTKKEFMDLAKNLQGRLAPFMSIKLSTTALEKFYSTHAEKVRGIDKNVEQDSFLFLSLPGSMSFLPWEAFTVFEGTLVSRVASIQIFEMLKSRHKTLPKPVDLRQTYYVLNPSGDLKKTEKRLGEVLQVSTWDGVKGIQPQKGQVLDALTNQDVFIYIGHGNGIKYIGSTNALQKSECRAACILMGCSSVEIADEGKGYDGRSVLHEFVVSHCPCLVGCLYTVTDGEIDGVFMELLRYLNEKGRKPSSGAETYRLLLRGVIQARKKCRLKLLTGHAVVCYGIPTRTENPIIEMASEIEKRSKY